MSWLIYLYNLTYKELIRSERGYLINCAFMARDSIEKVMIGNGL